MTGEDRTTPRCDDDFLVNVNGRTFTHKFAEGFAERAKEPPMSDPTRDALKEAPEGSPYAQPFTPDEIEDFWATHAMDNPSCETCRWLATITDLGFPGGHDAALSTTPAPLAPSLRHTLLFPPHPGEVYQSSALCSCGEWQFDSGSPGDLFNETRLIRQQWTEHAIGSPEYLTDSTVLADVLTELHISKDGGCSESHKTDADFVAVRYAARLKGATHE